MPRVRRRPPVERAPEPPTMSAEDWVRQVYGWPPGWDPRYHPIEVMEEHRRRIGWYPGIVPPRGAS